MKKKPRHYSRATFSMTKKLFLSIKKKEKVPLGWLKQHSQRKTAVSYMAESKSLTEELKEERELTQTERILL